MSGAENGGFVGPIMPAGMPPGTEYPSEERAPEGVLYFRIFGALLAVASGLMAITGGAVLVAGFVFRSSATSAAGADVGMLLTGLLYGGMGLVYFLPTLVALFGGRRPWVHTLGTVVIALGMFNFCCLPVLIPLLIVWMKPETQRWYGAR